MRSVFDNQEFDSIDDVADYIIENNLPPIATLRYFTGALVMIRVDFKNKTWEVLNEVI